jgi:hypothetical protein
VDAVELAPLIAVPLESSRSPRTGGHGATADVVVCEKKKIVSEKKKIVST